MTSKKRAKKQSATKTKKTSRLKSPEKPAPQPSLHNNLYSTKEEKTRHDDSLLIVAIGASAGGLEAFEQFFKNMPENSNMAFILIPHLSPEHKSIMPEILSRYSRMSIVQAENGTKVKPNCVYIIPPNKDMSILNGTLQTFDPVERRNIRHPIDFFFRALAQDRGEKAICIVLSGTGTEGTLGLKAIKGEGGLVLVQDPKTAKYDGMPASAVATGLADYVLPPDQMPSILVSYAKIPALRLSRPAAEHAAGLLDELQKIFIIIRTRTGHDFSQYKHNTVMRRIERRMAVLQIESIGDYVTYMRNNPPEVDTLFKELLIRVTNFFRDPEAYDALREKAFPLILRGKQTGQPIRIWVPGCSTGEEAYSLAILFHEECQKLKVRHHIQFFATDIDAGSIEIARSGMYPNSITVDVSPDRISRYFTKKDTVFKIKDEIREMVVFAEHDINKDPPFSKMDMISCRNLLIYVNADRQKRLLPLFRYALNSDGILFLGSSETVGDNTDIFSVLDKKWRIYKARRAEVLPLSLTDLRFKKETLIGARMPQMPEIKKTRDISIAEITEKLLLARYAPSCAVVDQEGTIVFLHGRTGKYLEPATGKASMNILDMAREGLRPDLRSALRKASSKKADIEVERLHIKTNGSFQTINLSVHHIKQPEHLQGLLLVVFQDLPTVKPEKTGKPRSVSERKLKERIEELELDLKSTREHLQSTIEELETSNEELQSSNEELQSANEELQSTNEEMETSKEELQSSNEELMTVNAELQDKMDELSQANNDMTNLLSSTKIATLFLDNNLCVKRFTPDVIDVINLIQSDLGRPLSDITLKIDYSNLAKDAEGVMAALGMKEKIVQHVDGAWYLARIIPYRTSKNVIEGVVITFVEITEQRRMQALQDAVAFSRGIVDAVREPLIVLNANLRVISANKTFYHTFKVTPEETEQKHLYELGDRQWEIPALRTALEDILPKSSVLTDFLVEHNFPTLGYRKLLLNAHRIQLDNMDTQTILLAIEDITGK
jgi:two-component system, chemotaxis family, CheB/CheR fusion protein